MKKIGFIGAGNMATAIIKGLIAQNGTAENLGVYDTLEEKCELMRALSVGVYPSSQELVRQSDIIVLAVKPQNYAEVLDAVREQANTDKTFVSIAAGISIGYVRRALGCDCPVVRVMPNTPLLLRKGATALCPSDGSGRISTATGFASHENEFENVMLNRPPLRTVRPLTMPSIENVMSPLNGTSYLTGTDSLFTTLLGFALLASVRFSAGPVTVRPNVSDGTILIWPTETVFGASIDTMNANGSPT